MLYEGDRRELAMEDIERALVEHFGESDYDREAGCYSNGEWMSVNSILSIIAYEC